MRRLKELKEFSTELLLVKAGVGVGLTDEEYNAEYQELTLLKAITSKKPYAVFYIPLSNPKEIGILRALEEANYTYIIDGDRVYVKIANKMSVRQKLIHISSIALFVLAEYSLISTLLTQTKPFIITLSLVLLTIWNMLIVLRYLFVLKKEITVIHKLNKLDTFIEGGI